MPAQLAFLSGSPGPGELILVFLAVLIFFGPKRLPSIARSIGKALHELRRASQDFREQIMRLDEDDQGHRAARDFIERHPMAEVAPEPAGRQTSGTGAGDVPGTAPGAAAQAGETRDGGEGAGSRGAGDDLAG